METKILDLFHLKGQVALVVGGNRGLGLIMAQTLAEAGARVAIVARDAAYNQKAEELIRADYQVDCLSTVCDVTHEDSVRKAVQRIHKTFGRIDVLINSAGINIRGAIDKLSLSDFNQVQQVNVTGTWLTCREVVPLMKQQRYGRIVNVGSMLSLIAMADRTPYAASKGAVLQMTRALALELAPDQITVNAILPGPFATEMNLPLTKDPEKYQAFVRQIPLGRWGELHEIGGLVLYLSSRASSYVTGAGFSIDGGWTAR